jgi:hypothetical protein
MLKAADQEKETKMMKTTISHTACIFNTHHLGACRCSDTADTRSGRCVRQWSRCSGGQWTDTPCCRSVCSSPRPGQSCRGGSESSQPAEKRKELLLNARTHRSILGAAGHILTYVIVDTSEPVKLIVGHTIWLQSWIRTSDPAT